MRVLAERANKGGKTAYVTSFEDHNGLRTSQVHTSLDEGTHQANNESLSSSTIPSKKVDDNTRSKKVLRYYVCGKETMD